MKVDGGMKYLYSLENLERCCERIKEELKVNQLKMSESNREDFSYLIMGKKSVRELKLTVEKESLEVYGEIQYTNEINYYLKERENSLFEVWEEIGQGPEKYTREIIKQKLLSKGIRVGLINEGIDKLIEKENIKVMLASGIPPIDDEQDEIKSYFQSKVKNYDMESSKNIDFRNLYSISNVKIGDVIGEKVIGKVGKDGLDIFGNIIARKKKKAIHIIASNGCKIVEGNVISTLAGRPTLKGNTFSVNTVYKMPSNVDIKSGNIDFIGDVDIDGSVSEGMKVNSGNSVTIQGNVEKAEVIGSGNIFIKGNVINSIIKAGAKDVEKYKCLSILEEYKNNLKNLLVSVQQFKEYNIKASAISDGEIVKLLIESKFKYLSKMAINIITNTITGVIENKSIAEQIKGKLLGAAPLNIKFANDLYDLVDIMGEEVDRLKVEVDIKVDVDLSYCQDAVIEASGDINLIGKGQYISKLKSLHNINFKRKDSVCRGGILEAVSNINASIIGTPSGATTTLKVGKYGVITADKVYHNTTFYIGERIYKFEENCRDVKAYIAKNGDLEIEKFIV